MAEDPGSEEFKYLYFVNCDVIKDLFCSVLFWLIWSILICPKMQQAIFKFHILETEYIVHSSDQMGQVKRFSSLLIMVYKNHKIRYYALSNLHLPVNIALK